MLAFWSKDHSAISQALALGKQTFGHWCSCLMYEGQDGPECFVVITEMVESEVVDWFLSQPEILAIEKVGGLSLPLQQPEKSTES